MVVAVFDCEAGIPPRFREEGGHEIRLHCLAAVGTFFVDFFLGFGMRFVPGGDAAGCKGHYVGDADFTFWGDELEEGEDEGVPFAENADDAAVAGVGVDCFLDVCDVNALFKEAEGLVEGEGADGVEGVELEPFG